jgi:hypothetical protein
VTADFSKCIRNLFGGMGQFAGIFPVMRFAFGLGDVLGEKEIQWSLLIRPNWQKKEIKR